MSQSLPRAFLAIGMKSMEEFLKKQLAKEFNFVGEAIYRSAVVSNALSCNPDIIVFRETLNGSEEILDIIYELRLQLPDSRIIFLASDRKPGDPLLAELVGNGVYDFVTGNRISAPDVMALMREPNKFSDVAMYRPRMNLSQTQKEMENSPPIKEVVKQVKETVFVEGDAPILPPSFGEKQKEKEGAAEKPKTKLKRSRRRFLKKKEEKKETVDETSVEENIHPTEHKEDHLFAFQPTPMEDTIPPRKEAPTNPPSKEVPLPTFKIEETIEEKKEEPTTELPLFKVKNEESPPKETLKPMEQPTFSFETKQEEPPNQKLTPNKKQVIPISQPSAPSPKETNQPKEMTKHVPKPTPLPVTTVISGNGKQKILTFVGGEHGVGNSQVAFNTALSLSKKGFRTIFIELKEQGSTIEYLYQLALVDKGLDYALRHISEENLVGLDNSIIKMKDVRSLNQKELMKSIYQQFPDSLDFLFFSPDYILETDPQRKAFDPMKLKELCMHLLFQMGYHYIILDAEPELHHPLSEVALGFGTHVFYTLTQDVSHIGRAVRNISEINKRINVVDKLYYILNKYDRQANLTQKDVEDWLKAKIESCIPLSHREFINANMEGRPVFLTTKNKELKQSFDQVVNHILKD